MGNNGDLSEFIVGTVPTVFYIPEFVSAAEEELLSKNIYKAPVSKWKILKNRRLQNWGGVVHEKGLLPQELPSWLKNVTQRIHENTRLFPSAINHVLINEYLPDQGILPHQDGPAYAPVVAILSLGGPVVMDFSPHPSISNADSTAFSIILKPRSLLIFKDKAYTEYLHGIKDCAHQRCAEAVNFTKEGEAEEHQSDTMIHRTSTRMSLTCRHVTRVHKNIIRL